MKQDDHKIIQGLIDKDHESINEFIDLFGNYIYALVYNVCGAKQDSEEATQDVVLKIIKNAEKFDFSCNLKTWIYTIAKRTAIDYKRRVKHVDDLSSIFSMKSDDNPTELIVKSDETKMIENMLSTLKVLDRQLIELFYLKELTIAEIGDITGLSISNIKVKLFRARQILAENFQKSDYEL